MSDRKALADDFLSGAEWSGCTLEPLAGDASQRKYLRLRKGPETAVLMDAPPDRGEDVRPFIAMAEHLISLGLSAPRILARDVATGFLLLEDLGDDLFVRRAAREPDIEETLYSCAVDVLIALHKHPAPDGLGRYDTEMMVEKAALSLEWYGADTGATLTRDFQAVMGATLAAHAAGGDVLTQRDYHAENLLWLPDRAGPGRVGLLDFQDAMRGHVAYDLMSLLQDARRDVPPELAKRMIERYIRKTGQDPNAFDAAYHVLGAQRNLRILGVFARLCLRDGKAHYVDLVPRVWAHLMHDLDHPALADLAPLVHRALPRPTSATLRSLKDRCQPRQTP